jgi:hypothetical protein
MSSKNVYWYWANLLLYIIVTLFYWNNTVKKKTLLSWDKLAPSPPHWSSLRSSIRFISNLGVPSRNEPKCSPEKHWPVSWWKKQPKAKSWLYRSIYWAAIQRRGSINFVCLWRRHNCNWSLLFCADLLIYEINFCVLNNNNLNVIISTLLIINLH